MNKILSKTYPPFSLHKEFIANRGKKKPLLPIFFHYFYYWYIKQPVHLIHSQSIVIGDNPLLAPLILLAQSIKNTNTSTHITPQNNNHNNEDLFINNLPENINNANNKQILILQNLLNKPTIEPIAIITTNLDPWDYRFAFEEFWVQTLCIALADFCKHFEHVFKSINCATFEPPATPDIEYCYNWIFFALKKFNAKIVMDIKALPFSLLPFAYITHPETNLTKLPSNQQKALLLLRSLAHKHDLLYSPLNCAMLNRSNLFFSNNYHWNSQIPPPLILPNSTLFSTSLYGRSKWNTNNPEKIHFNSRADIFSSLSLNQPDVNI